MSSRTKGTRSRQEIITGAQHRSPASRLGTMWVPDQETGLGRMGDIIREKRAKYKKIGRAPSPEALPEEQLEKKVENEVEVEVRSSTDNPQPCRFVDLPLEIKCEIYKLLLTQERDVLWTHTPLYKTRPGKCVDDVIEPPKRHTAILRVSKQIHDEAAAILVKHIPEMMISTLPQKYRDLVLDVTLRAYDRDVSWVNLHIWTDVKARERKHGPTTMSTVRGNLNTALFRGAIWNAVRFTPQTAFEVEPLFKCWNLKKLTIELMPNLYTLAWGGGSHGHRMEEVEGIKELLKTRGLRELKLVDLANIDKNFPHLTKAKKMLERLLREELSKPQRVR